MKHLKLLYLGLILSLILPQNLFSQAPDGVNYQAVVRNALGLPLNTQAVSVRFSIHQGSPTGTVVFTETQPTTTNQFGLINLELGSVNNLAFSTINWGTGGAYYLQIEVDAGTGFDDLGASQLLSVPYALFARSAATGMQGYNSLIDTVSATLLECPTGGYRVNIGLDANASTFLEAGEITSSFVVCNGSTGAANLNDTSATNEIQTLSINLDTIFLSNGGGSIVLPSLGDNDWIIAGNDMSSGITGNVGIGVLLPAKKLSIRSLAPGGDGIEINNASATGNPGLEFQTQGTPRYVLGVDQTDNNKFKIGTTAVGINPRLTINGAGQVGVGTTSPQYQFSVQSADSVVASFTGTNPNVAAITIANPNPTAVAGIVMLSGVDSGMIAVDPANKTLWLSHSTPGGHTGIYADSAVALYGDVIGNISRSTIINQADTIYNLPLTSNLINVNLGSFYTDSLSVLGNNFSNPNWVLANNGFGQAVWTDPTTLPGGGGGLWQPSGPDIYFNTGKVGIGIGAPQNALEVYTPALNTFARFTNSTSDTLVNDGVFLGINSGDAYFNNAENGNMLFYTNNTERVRVDNTGNVGIGTPTPNANLDVTGTTETDNLRVVAGSGTAGQVLTSDAAGNATWQTPTASAAGWGLLGNAGTTPATNFIGTTDAQNLEFRTNNILRTRITQKGQIEILNTGNSVFIGEGAGAADDLTVNNNVFVGYNSGIVNTNGENNTAVGYISFFNNISGSYNATTGYQSLLFNTTGNNNTSNGYQSLQQNTTGNNNTGLGYRSGVVNTIGTDNTFLGYSADASINNLTNATAIGANTIVSQSNSLILGNNANVGIGTATPNSLLEVLGLITTDSLIVTTGAGTLGNVLTDDGTGTAVWQAPSGGAAAWILAGNTGTSVLSDAIGTLDAQDFAIITNGAERIRITQTGNVGIGTTTPVSSFNIIYAGADAEAGLINYSNNTASAGGTGFFVNANNTGSGSITAGGFQVNNSSNALETVVLEAMNIGNGTTNYGLRSAISSTGATNYGIYSEVNGAGTNWAAYFADGDVYFADALVIPTGAVSGAVLTSDAAGNASWKPNQIAFEARATTPQPMNAAPSLLQLDAVSFDDGGNFNPAAGNYSFTAPVAGVYSIQANVLFDYTSAGPNDVTIVEILLNGGPIYTSDTPVVSGERTTNSISSTIQLNAGDQLQVNAFVIFGGAVISTGSADEVWFSGHLVYAY